MDKNTQIGGSQFLGDAPAVIYKFYIAASTEWVYYKYSDILGFDVQNGASSVGIFFKGAKDVNAKDLVEVNISGSTVTEEEVAELLINAPLYHQVHKSTTAIITIVSDTVGESLRPEFTSATVTFGTCCTGGGGGSTSTDAVIEDVQFDSNVTKGTAVYISGPAHGSGRPRVDIADANDVTKMPVVGLAYDNYSAGQGKIIITGILDNIDTSSSNIPGGTTGQVVYVDNSGTTNNLIGTRPTGTDLVQNVGIIAKPGASGSLQVSCIGRTNDVPNLAQGNIWIGNASGVATKLPIGVSGTTLRSNGTTASWVAPIASALCTASGGVDTSWTNRTYLAAQRTAGTFVQLSISNLTNLSFANTRPLHATIVDRDMRITGYAANWSSSSSKVGSCGGNTLQIGFLKATPANNDTSYTFTFQVLATVDINGTPNQLLTASNAGGLSINVSRGDMIIPAWFLSCPSAGNLADFYGWLSIFGNAQ